MGKINMRFSDFTVRTKIIVLNTLFVVSILILGTFAQLFFNSSQTISILINCEKVFIRNADSGIEHFYKYEVSGDSDDLEQSKKHLQKAILLSYSFSKIDSIVNSLTKKDWIPFLYDTYKEGVNYDKKKIELLGNQVKLIVAFNHNLIKDLQQDAFEVSKLIDGMIEKIDYFQSNKNTQTLNELQVMFDEVHAFSNSFTSSLYDINDYFNKFLLVAIIVLVILLGLIVSIISLRISASISNPINKLVDNFKLVAKGNLGSSVEINKKNELGDLSRAFFEIQYSLLEIIHYTKKVAKGDFGKKLKPKSDEDELTPALNEMAAKLENNKLRVEKEAWLQTGINNLDDKMRGNFSVRELSDRIIHYLSDFLNFEMGAVYVYDEVLEHLEFTGSIGIKQEAVQKIIKVGEGLIGKAARNNALQIIETREKYHKTYSATGEMIPAIIYLLPMQFDNHPQAVIEIAPLNELSEIKIEFLKIISGRISVNLGAAVARYRSNELLNTTMDQAKSLKQKEDELSKQLEENIAIQNKLVQEKALIDSMLKIIPDLIHVKDLDGRFIRISESLLDLFGVESSDELIGKTDFDFYDSKEAQKYYDEEKQIAEKGEGFVDRINENIDENGNKTWTSVSKLPLFDDNGKCIGTFSISKNVTDIKMMEIKLKERNEKLNAQQEELRTINEELKAQEEELRVANEELAEQTKVLAESEKSLQVQQEELRVTNEELEAKGKELEQRQNEITEKNKNLLKTQEELKLASQYKSEFLANMSHELRTPLNSMLILSKLLGNNKNGNLTEDQVKSVNIIHKSGRDLLELINEILDLSKIEAGKMAFEFNEVPVSGIIEEINQGFNPVAESKGLQLEINKAEDFPEKLYTDKLRLQQVIKNLLSNAFKFTSSGSVKVNFKNTGPQTKFNNNKLNHKNTCCISVEDTGVGIPKDKLNNIFEAFQQADGSISRKFGGTGLGLSISKQIMAAFGGEIHVESTEGVGSGFILYLPLDQNLIHAKTGDDKKNGETEVIQPEEADVKDSIRETPKKKKTPLPNFVKDDRNTENDWPTVLVIHSEKEKAKQIIELCHNRKFNAVVAAAIPDGIKLAEAHSPQAIIISAKLYDSNEMKDLRENKSTGRLPLHLVSRIEDSVFDNMEELTTPETDTPENSSKNIENKLNKEFKQILVVEDDPATRESIQLLFENKDILIHEAKTAQQAYDMIAARPFDCVILDLGLPDFSGNELLKKLSSDQIPIPYVIIHTAKDLNSRELRELQKYSDSIVIKGIKSDERLLDEVTLFLHQIKNSVSEIKQKEILAGDDDEVFKGKKVLIVDDDIRNIFALAQILEEKEIEILEAENGEVAIEVLKQNPDVDLVLMDIMMPVMNGYDAMSQIRKTPKIKNVPIITLTAKAMKEDYQKAIDSGANDYISKPVDTDKLISLLKIWLFK